MRDIRNVCIAEVYARIKKASKSITACITILRLMRVDADFDAL